MGITWRLGLEATSVVVCEAGECLTLCLTRGQEPRHQMAFIYSSACLDGPRKLACASLQQRMSSTRSIATSRLAQGSYSAPAGPYRALTGRRRYVVQNRAGVWQTRAGVLAELCRDVGRVVQGLFRVAQGSGRSSSLPTPHNDGHFALSMPDMDGWPAPCAWGQRIS